MLLLETERQRGNICSVEITLVIFFVVSENRMNKDRRVNLCYGNLSVFNGTVFGKVKIFVSCLRK